ncbi:MAG: Mut7-C RNAse domain-containing protein [Bacillota bacterium]
MKKAFFRFYAGLNRFFSINKDGKIHTHYFQGRQSIKDRIETLGVPHTEVYLILKRGEAVEFSYLVKDGDRFSIFPGFKDFTLDKEIRLRTPYPGKPKFIADTHLGKLARYLRRFGFNTLYENDYRDKEIVDIALSDNRIILTRDHGLLMRKRVKYGCFIHYDDPRKQLYSVYGRYDLNKYDHLMGRCVECNTILEPVAKEKIIDRLEPKTKKYFHKFYICQNCNKIYWKGSHYQKTEALIKTIEKNLSGGN